MSTLPAFPATIRYFNDKRNSIDDLLDFHLNIPQAEITAIEENIGVGANGGYASIADRLDAITSWIVGSSTVVSTLNGLSGDLNLQQEDSTIVITASGNSILIKVGEVPWGQISSKPTEFVPTSGSNYYIWNQTLVNQTAAFSIAGVSKISGKLSIIETVASSGLPLAVTGSIGVSNTSGTGGSLSPSGLYYINAYYGDKFLQVPIIYLSNGDTEPNTDGAIWYDYDNSKFFRFEDGVKKDFNTLIPDTTVYVWDPTTQISNLQRVYTLPSAAYNVYKTKLYKNGLRLCPNVDYTLGTNGQDITLTVADSELPKSGDRFWCDYLLLPT